MFEETQTGDEYNGEFGKLAGLLIKSPEVVVGQPLCISIWNGSYPFRLYNVADLLSSVVQVLIDLLSSLICCFTSDLLSSVVLLIC